jgi:hypothetical protein
MYYPLLMSCKRDDPKFLGCKGWEISSAFDYVIKYGVGP